MAWCPLRQHRSRGSQELRAQALGLSLPIASTSPKLHPWLPASSAGASANSGVRVALQRSLGASRVQQGNVCGFSAGGQVGTLHLTKTPHAQQTRCIKHQCTSVRVMVVCSTRRFIISCEDDFRQAARLDGISKPVSVTPSRLTHDHVELGGRLVARLVGGAARDLGGAHGKGGARGGEAVHLHSPVHSICGWCGLCVRDSGALWACGRSR